MQTGNTPTSELGTRTVPDESLAHQIVVETLGQQPREVRRFPTGLMHYVYEATCDGQPPVVVRLAASYGHADMRGAARLSRLLRPRGVPLPAILAEKLDGSFPCLILERLPGSDLGDMIAHLPPERLEDIATAVVNAQRITAALPNAAGKYGYAVAPEMAPCPSWSKVLAAHLQRSRRRIAAAGIFTPDDTAPLAAVLEDMRRETDDFLPTAFLHDTTTKNVIVTADGQFSGIVDVDSLCFGDPRYAVALTQAALLARGVSLAYTRAWMRLAGFAEDRLFRVYVALFLVDFLAERGTKFNRAEVATDFEYDQGLHRCYLDALAQL